MFFCLAHQQAGWMSRAPWHLQLSPPSPALPFIPAGPLYPFRHCSKTGLCSQLLSCPVEAVMDIPEAQRSRQCPAHGKVMQVHVLQSNFSLGDADLSAALYHPLVIHEVLPAKSRDAAPHPQQEALRWRATKIQTVPPVILLAGSL